MHLNRVIAIALLFFPAFASAAPELAPTPRVVENHVFLEKMQGGYQILLSKRATENLREALKEVGDGRPYADMAKQAVKELNDPAAERKLELLAFLVRTQVPAMRKALEEKAGPNGATIKVFGIEAKRLKNPRPTLWAIGAAFLPPEVREQIEAGAVMVNTTPLIWRVEPR